MKKIKQLLAILSILLLSNSYSMASDPLLKAYALSANYEGWTYGSNATKKQVDCVQFILALVENCLASSLSTKERNAILIAHGWSTDETQIIATLGEDIRLKGVVYALVDLLKAADTVPPAEIQAGDFVQCWYKTSEGTWLGHAAIVERREHDKIFLYGSHQSTDGIGVAPERGLKLLGDNRRIYAARLN